MSSLNDCHLGDYINVSFACQRCCQPLKMDSSLATINEQMIQELSSNAVHENSNECIPKEYNPSVIYKHVPPLGLKEVSLNGNGLNGFLMIGTDSIATTSYADAINKNLSNAHKLSHDVKVCSRLFDILSDQSDIDHPLCEECADFVIDRMDHELSLLEDECKDYREYIESLEGQQNAQNDEQEMNELIAKLAELESIEARLTQELKQIKDEQQLVTEEINQQSKELQRLFSEEDKYWHEYNNLRNQVFACDDEQQSIDNQLRFAQAQLDKLKRTNVFNATFHIWHNGHFGTINNFRMGRLPNIPVEWAEINAAWGQAALLLHSLAKKMDLTFKRYKLVPYGNHSFLESLEDKSRELPLYASGGIRYFWNSKFDQAMVAFLDCLQQFKEEVEKGDSGFCLPYRMDKGKIEDTKTGNTYSVKIQFNSEEQWTKALKFMLTNLKWALAWVSSQFINKPSNE